MIYGELLSALDALGVCAKESYPLRDSVSLKIPSVAALAVFPDTVQKLCSSLQILREQGVRIQIVGNGSNLFFACERFEGAVLFTRGISEISATDEPNTLRASCGASFGALASRAAQMGLSGLEFAYGIPGTVGGAVYMNAGAYGGAVSDVLTHSLVYDGERTFALSAKEHALGYRSSIFMTSEKPLVCLETTFRLVPAPREEIEARMRENMRARREKQPLEYPSAGSYFKRPEGYFAGKLIEDCGLKGFCVGGAAVSEKHAGFVINKGGATAEDILALEGEVRKRVLESFGVLLQREVRVIE